MMDALFVVIILGGAALAWCHCISIHYVRKEASELQDQIIKLADKVDKDNEVYNENQKSIDEAIQAICPHEEWDYRTYGHTLGIGNSYSKICPVCAKKIYLSAEEYKQGIREIEVKSIRQSRDKLNARMKELRENA